jgi:glycosyltransferase involved in cell wall biosynthesis
VSEDDLGTGKSWPDVDVVMPVRNEAGHLESAIESVRSQGYPGRLRIYIAVAPSNDGTEAIARSLAATIDDVHVVPNPVGTTPAGLNAAIRAGSAPVVVRVDGHSRLDEGYIERAVTTLRRTGAANVGGTQVPEPATPFEEAVAAATASWLGTGGATYRSGGCEGPVDTVYLGVFDRSAIEAVGLFDERLIRNQDYELNIRLRKAGGTVWFDPALTVGYRPRGTWRDLARQYYEYGYWKAVVLRLHPGSARPRQMIPPIAMLVTVLATLGSMRRPALATIPATYVAAVLSRGRRPGAVLATMHTAWTGGLFWAMIRPPDRSSRRAWSEASTA